MNVSDIERADLEFLPIAESEYQEFLATGTMPLRVTSRLEAVFQYMQHNQEIDNKNGKYGEKLHCIASRAAAIKAEAAERAKMYGY